MYALLFLLALPNVLGFQFQFNVQFMCVDDSLQYCKELTDPCQGVLAPITASRNLTLQICSAISGVRNADVGTTHVFSLMDPFGHWVCHHRLSNKSSHLNGWGVKIVTLSILSKGFGQSLIQPDPLCSGGYVYGLRQSHEMVHVCVKFSNWHWEDVFRLFIVEPVPTCNLRVRPLISSTTYTVKPAGRLAKPVDEL